MSTQLELDISSVNLDKPLAEQPEILDFLGNPQGDKDITTFSRKLMYRLTLLVKKIVKNEYPNLVDDKLSVAISYDFTDYNSESDSWYVESCSISDSNRFKTAPENQTYPFEDSEAHIKKTDFFERILVWVSQGVDTLLPFFAEGHLSQISLSFIWIEDLLEDKSRQVDSDQGVLSPELYSLRENLYYTSDEDNFIELRFIRCRTSSSYCPNPKPSSTGGRVCGCRG